jgi:hypothetical protein
MNDVMPNAAGPAARPPRRAYEAPAVLPLGDLRELTLGASPGAGDSGGPTTFRCPGCP